MLNVAVVGGGIFGVTAALMAARKGHKVMLFERNAELLQAASGINQYRLHKGYHYPRSIATARSSNKAIETFRREFDPAIIKGGNHTYAIASHGSRTSAARYREFCDRVGLPYSISQTHALFTPGLVEAFFRAEEARIDIDVLRGIAEEKLRRECVIIELGSEFNAASRPFFHKVILAAYSENNDVSRSIGAQGEVYQFEICEKPVVRLPDEFKEESVVVLDGNFVCVDPLGTTGLHVMGHVSAGVHASNNGYRPIIPEV